MADLAQLLSFALKNSASDLHLSSGLAPVVRIDGELKVLDHAPLAIEELKSLIYAWMSTAQIVLFEKNLELDFSFAIPNIGRVRANLFTHNRGLGLALRLIPASVLSFEQLRTPQVLQEIINYPRGLVLVTGPTGCGKSTTLATMVDYLNTHKPYHILTIEDPIEVLHTSKRALISQREVLRDTLSFQNALRASLREDPDVILVGELRDLETIRLALTAAETGHLVLATLHTSSATKSIDRIVDVFPAEEKSLVRSMLSESLKAVVAQTLLKKASGAGRVAAFEIMLVNHAIKNLIREAKVAQMYSVMQTSKGEGMQTFEQAMQYLVQVGLISSEEFQRNQDGIVL